LFVAALATTRLFIPVGVQYYFLLYFLLANNYNTVVNNIVSLKNPYAALCHALPILLVFEVCGSGSVPYLLTPSVFLFSLGREIMMDLRDVDGDGATLVKLVSSKVAQIIAFTLQSLGVILLGLCADTVLRQAAFCVILMMHGFLAVRAACGAPPATLVRLMKIQFAAGTAFLL
jgi:4-hydroxybenzoate polyprenyltransferase